MADQRTRDVLASPVPLRAFLLEDTGKDVTTVGETCSGTREEGQSHLFTVRGWDNLRLTLRDTRWENGERDVTAVGGTGPPQVAAALIRHLRQPVITVDATTSLVDLNQARVALNTEPFAATLFQADQAQHDLATGLDTAELLGVCRATCGPRSSLLGDRSPRQSEWCAVFPTEVEIVPVLSFVLTRVIPISNMWFDPASRVLPSYVVPDRAKHEGVRRIYVILLDPEAGSRGERPVVYVGQTGKPRADRFREHIIRHKNSPIVTAHGLRLAPELYPDIEPLDTHEEALDWEARWAAELGARGMVVHGGH